jgi:hypothetical protein
VDAGGLEERRRGVGFGLGGGVGAVTPRTGTIGCGRQGMNMRTTASRAITASPTRIIFTSRPRGALGIGRGRGVQALGSGRFAAACSAAAAWSAWARVVPQWQVETRLGTRRLQFGHSHVTDDIGLPS